MAIPIKIPDVGVNVNSVVLLKWLKQPGDTVKRGDPLCEVETDKAATEIESVAQGTLLKQLVSSGTEVEIGTVIAYVGQPGEATP
jgi:pyruvate/2-oxoglutarate dehydrogenase complex dihydrolipoamide acyltransferase (E2) component